MGQTLALANDVLHFLHHLDVVVSDRVTLPAKPGEVLGDVGPASAAGNKRMVRVPPVGERLPALLAVARPAEPEQHG
jgi:hypothetical protein